MLDEAKRVVVVAAHPDDLEAVIGGTVALLTGRGATVWLVLCTSGDIGSHEPEMDRKRLASLREEEARNAARLLGVEDVFCLGHPDGELMPTLELRKQLAALYRKLQPDTLLTFDPFNRGQVHADHRAAGQAALDAYMPSKMPLYHTEQLADGITVANLQRVYLFNSDQPNLWVDIGGSLDLKVQAMLAHKTQTGDGDRTREWLTNWARETARGLTGIEFAEAFQKVSVW